MKLGFFVCVSLIAATQFLTIAAENDARIAELQGLADHLKYQSGKISLREGNATINLPDSFRYLDPDSSATLLTKIWGNPPSERQTLGIVVPSDFNPLSRGAWCVVVNYQDDGYVKDQDAESINYDKLLKEMKAATREASAERVKNGYPAIELVGWAAAPRYDQQTHKFYWAKEIKFGGGGENTLNYNLRVLGRRGVMTLNAVSGMSQLPQIEEATPQILGMVDFNEGHRYADYQPGTDKLAAYGLAALVAGGIAVKTGLFKGLLLAILALKKFIIIGVIAVITFVRKLFSAKKPITS